MPIDIVVDAMGSDKAPEPEVRGAILAARHYGVRVAFQNCCAVGVFEPDAEDARIEFTSPEAQVLNQKPELRNC